MAETDKLPVAALKRPDFAPLLEFKMPGLHTETAVHIEHGTAGSPLGA